MARSALRSFDINRIHNAIFHRKARKYGHSERTYRGHFKIRSAFNHNRTFGCDFKLDAKLHMAYVQHGVFELFQNDYAASGAKKECKIFQRERRGFHQQNFARHVDSFVRHFNRFSDAHFKRAENWNCRGFDVLYESDSHDFTSFDRSDIHIHIP